MNNLTDNILLRKYKKQIDGQKLLLDIFKLLENIESESEVKIKTVLEYICTYSDFDGVRIALCSENEKEIVYVDEWITSGVKLKGSMLEYHSKDTLGNLREELNKKDYFLVRNLLSLQDYSWIDKELLISNGIQSFLLLPLKYNNKFIGLLDFYLLKEIPDFQEEDVLLFQSIAHILSNAFIRKDMVEALKESENYYRTIFNSTGTAKVIIEKDNTISKVNAECVNIFGVSKEELIGKKWADYFNNKNVEHIKNTEEFAAIFSKYITKYRNPLGKVYTLIINANLIPETESTVITLYDVSELYQVKRALQAISACNMAMIHAADEMELVQTVCEKIIEVGGYYMAWVGYVANDEMRTIYPVAHAGNIETYLKDIKIQVNHPVLGNGPFGRVVKTCKTVITRSIAEDETFAPWREEIMKIGGKSLISFPLLNGDEEPFGVLGIGSNQEDVFDDEEVIILTEMASDLTYGIISLRARAERDKTAKQLEYNLSKMRTLLNQTVASLSNVVEMRDPYTAGHQRKVAQLSTAIAKELGLSNDEAEGIFIAATIHDIGKINIPSEILSKPGLLNYLEFEIIKGHSQAGYDIIKDTNYPWPIAEYILQHHEKMDGSGYPLGLKGEDIILGARIITVADVVEAMAYHRPYRPALGLEKALEEITQNRGIKYDPSVVDACLNVFANKGFEFED
ncbi:HD domain-containing phosphohydrolase [Anaerocolumna sp.]|uniref:HD domain-containing phosphohydrolase n=1 Tax=Anaerocolumna sp. TaxID=2041569 RepID=UPI0028A93AB6|nr:HD domain-containing phosphohydrolase [Anaerocolumna sp.]